MLLSERFIYWYVCVKLRVMCGTPEFVAPEVVNYDVVDTSTGQFVVPKRSTMYVMVDTSTF